MKDILCAHSLLPIVMARLAAFRHILLWLQHAPAHCVSGWLSCVARMPPDVRPTVVVFGAPPTFCRAPRRLCAGYCPLCVAGISPVPIQRSLSSGSEVVGLEILLCGQSKMMSI